MAKKNIQRRHKTINLAFLFLYKKYIYLKTIYVNASNEKSKWSQNGSNTPSLR